METDDTADIDSSHVTKVECTYQSLSNNVSVFLFLKREMKLSDISISNQSPNWAVLGSIRLVRIQSCRTDKQRVNEAFCTVSTVIVNCFKILLFILSFS